MGAKKRILLCATVDYHFSAFHLPYMKWFKEQGWEVHVAAKGDMELPFVDKKYDLPIQRSPFSQQNVKAYQQLKAIIDENDYQIIHCHTPVGGVLARLASRAAREKGTKVLYTAHGFHFCKGSPVINWLIYYPIEKWLARSTDCLITINEEDFNRAIQHQFKAARIEHVHGVGVNTETFRPAEKEYKKELRIAYGYNVGDLLMFYAAEFNKNKNQQLLIQALAQVKDEVSKAKLLLAGEGPLLQECRKLAIKLGVEDQVHFLGFRKDIEQLLQISDVAVGSSLREGLPVNIMEAMACGLPVIVTENRGHRELITNQQEGWLIQGSDPQMFAKKMKLLAKDPAQRAVMGSNGRRLIINKFSTNKVLQEKSAIYKPYMGETEDAQWAVQ
ncbi:glycosyltransferase family 4 protein [Mesobacillus subterraneus]|uniref:glycosyltransferase family 4 protein n=1 Tax=Mesobacillus subterraneus TaxID=285983 RepID=UPI001CFC9223|nr:glycosyltransferase family 4 protein [Mesobacillus subterraneus]